MTIEILKILYFNFKNRHNVTERQDEQPFRIDNFEYDNYIIFLNDQIVGVLLSNKKWAKLLNNRWDHEMVEYMRKAKELAIPLLFFTIDFVDEEERTTKGLKLENDSIQILEKVKVPKVIFRPKPIIKKALVKKWRNLLLDQDYKIINEHYIIKKKHVIEMMKSSKFLRQYLAKDELSIKQGYLFTGWLQKNINNEIVKWELTARFTYLENKLNTWEDAIKLQFPSLSQSKINEKIQQIEQAIYALIDIIQIYYPGIDEIGFQYYISEQGKVYFYQLISKKNSLKLVYQWDVEIWSEVLTKPLHLARYYSKKEAMESE